MGAGLCPCALNSGGSSATTGRPFLSEPVQAPVACDEREAGSDGGGRDMLVGALWCVGGIVVTVASYGAAASNPGGGRYVVAYGAIIFGAIQFIRGAMR